MVGIGRGKIASKAVTLPISLQWAQKPVDMQLYVGDTPEGVDILMGLDIQEPLGTIIDRPASVIRFQGQKVEVKTESTARVTTRMKTPPITVVATNAGCNFAYAAVRNAGFTVQKWYSVEEDAVCRHISDTIVPAEELVHSGNRTDQVGNKIDRAKVDLFIDTSPCQPWSRCNGLTAKGFGNYDVKGSGDSRSATFKHADGLYKRLRKTNPNIKHSVENVVPARHLKKDHVKMEEMYGSKFTEINARQWGAGHSRPRNIATNICD